jgi:predicted SnoaL-like aldol condensation-catalyzing enzyme
MKVITGLFLTLLVLPAFAALPVVPAPAESQAAMLQSDNPQLAANKKLVYDFWRSVLVGGHMDETEKYMAKDYIQHNPNAETGRDGFLAFFRDVIGLKPVEVKSTIDDLVSLTAEGDLVTLSFVRTYDDPNKPGQKYTTTWFDMFRIQDGLIVEHWDSALVEKR